MKRIRTAKRKQGFSLLETMFAFLLASLIFIGTLSLCLDTTRVAAKVSAANDASLDAAKALNKVTDRLREAYAFRLPGDANFIESPDIPNNYRFSSGGDYILTGMRIILPKKKGDAANPSTFASVQNSAGGTIVLNTDANQLLDRGAAGTVEAGAVLMLYRGNENQTPNPTSGTHLWLRNLAPGSTPELILRSVSSDPKAVQFKRDAFNGASVKIVAGHYSRIIGEQTNEATDGSKVTTLRGRFVLLRNTRINSVPEPPPPTTPTPIPAPTVVPPDPVEPIVVPSTPTPSSPTPVPPAPLPSSPTPVPPTPSPSSPTPTPEPVDV